MQNGRTTVKGKSITVFEEVIAKVSRLPTEGIKWIEKHVQLHESGVVFKKLDEELISKGKGIHPASLKEPWRELETIV